jgi:hypothetical protein
MLAITAGCAGGGDSWQEPRMPPIALPIAAPTPARAAELYCNGSLHDAELLANIVIDEVLALQTSVPPLAKLSRHRDVSFPRLEKGASGSVRHARGSAHADTSHCLPGKMCAAHTRYDPGAFGMVITFYTDADLHRLSQGLTSPHRIGPLFVTVSVEGAADVDIQLVRSKLNSAIDIVMRRHQGACG